MTHRTGQELITSAANPAVKAARRIARRPPRGSRELIVEGPQAVAEATGALRRVFVADSAELRHAALLAEIRAGGVPVLLCSDAVLAGLTDTVTPQGLVGVATLPAARLEDVTATAGLLVALVEIRDPGNLGAVIRTADAAGATGVVLVGDCVDPRISKSVRASAGSVCHLPVVAVPTFDELSAACRASGVAVLAADARASLPYTEADLARPCALVFGNEAHGLDPSVTAACDGALRVPLSAPLRPGWSGAAESLNLAATAAVMTFEAARQRALAEAVALTDSAGPGCGGVQTGEDGAR